VSGTSDKARLGVEICDVFVCGLAGDAFGVDALGGEGAWGGVATLTDVGKGIMLPLTPANWCLGGVPGGGSWMCCSRVGDAGGGRNMFSSPIGLNKSLTGPDCPLVISRFHFQSGVSRPESFVTLLQCCCDCVSKQPHRPIMRARQIFQPHDTYIVEGSSSAGEACP